MRAVLIKTESHLVCQMLLIRMTGRMLRRSTYVAKLVSGFFLDWCLVFKCAGEFNPLG